MRKFGSLSFFISVILLIASYSKASSIVSEGTISRCYRVAEGGLDSIDQSPYILCLTSSDLQKYPKSVVTVTLTMKPDLSTEAARALASKDNNEVKAKPELLAKRHYTKLSKNEYGRISHPEKPGLAFDPNSKTVYLGFAGPQGKRFYYKKID